MPVKIDTEAADSNSRLTAIRLVVLTARFMELWRRGTRDTDTVMILIAVAAITAERLTRIELDEEMKALEHSFPSALLAPCNISSIAAATGLNRETARRRVNAMVKEGSLVRNDKGEVYFPPGLLQQPGTRKLIRKQLEMLTRFVNDSIRDGVLRIG